MKYKPNDYAKKYVELNENHIVKKHKTVSY